MTACLVLGPGVVRLAVYACGETASALKLESCDSRTSQFAARAPKNCRTSTLPLYAPPPRALTLPDRSTG